MNGILDSFLFNLVCITPDAITLYPILKMVIGSLSHQRLESPDSVVLYWLPLKCLDLNFLAEVQAPFLYLCVPYGPCPGTLGR